MSRRLLAVAATVAAATLTTSAEAAVFPVCTARLAAAAAGAATWCNTGGVPAMTHGQVRRTVTTQVVTGAARVTLTCGFGTAARSVTATVNEREKPRSISLYETSDGACRTDLVALVSGTTAAAASTFAYTMFQV